MEKYLNTALGEEESVLTREVSLFQGLKIYKHGIWGGNIVLIRDVSLFQGLKSTQIQYLGKKKVS